MQSVKFICNFAFSILWPMMTQVQVGRQAEFVSSASFKAKMLCNTTNLSTWLYLCSINTIILLIVAINITLIGNTCILQHPHFNADSCKCLQTCKSNDRTHHPCKNTFLLTSVPSEICRAIAIHFGGMKHASTNPIVFSIKLDAANTDCKTPEIFLYH